MKHPEHDVPSGKLDRCQITGSANLFEVIDLGFQAPCDSMLTKEQLNEPEVTYPLRLYLCPESGLAQLDYVVDNGKLFHPDYPYRSGVSEPLIEYQIGFATHAIAKVAVSAGSLCVDIGSNDGTLLAGFAERGMKVLGVEPTNVARIAEEQNHVETIQAFFTARLGREIATSFGRAKLITATNAFAHMATLGEVCAGIEALLDDDGVFITESHYLLDVLERNQFDTILHEHLRTYSLKSLVKLFPFYGLEVFDVERGDRYGGNVRAYAGRAGRRPIAGAVTELLRVEEEAGLFRPETWAAFRARVSRNRDRFMHFLWTVRSIEGRLVAAQSCPGRCSTLINYFGITRDLLPYIGELPNSLKLGLYLPGAHIPVVGNQRLVSEQPDYVLINAWHYAEAVAKRLRSEGVESALLVALPEFEILSV